MSKRHPELLVDDIIASGRKIQQYTVDLTFDQFIQDSKTVDAVIRNFEIIGEAANRLPEDYKELHANIDWHKLKGFRNRIVHDYMGIDYDIVWQIKEHFLPELLKTLETLRN